MGVIGSQLIGGHSTKGTIGPVRLLPCFLSKIVLFLGHSGKLDNIGLLNYLPLKYGMEIGQRYNYKKYGYKKMDKKGS
tara:strand:- start:8823 stop:9056 length:234 start_codon:yes stop_codon:yes gene_type:complete